MHHWPDSPQRIKKRRSRRKYQKLGGWRKCKRQNSIKKKDKRQDKRKKLKKRCVKSTKRLPDFEFNSSNNITISKCELATDKHSVMSPNENALLNDPTILLHYLPLILYHDYFNVRQSERFELVTPVTSLALPIRDTIQIQNYMELSYVMVTRKFFSEEQMTLSYPSPEKHFRELNCIIIINLYMNI